MPGEMRAWCFVENMFEINGWKNGVAGEER